MLNVKTRLCGLIKRFAIFISDRLLPPNCHPTNHLIYQRWTRLLNAFTFTATFTRSDLINAFTACLLCIYDPTLKCHIINASKEAKNWDLKCSARQDDRDVYRYVLSGLMVSWAWAVQGLAHRRRTISSPSTLHTYIAHRHCTHHILVTLHKTLPIAH